jgi:hypothetical protein
MEEHRSDAQGRKMHALPDLETQSYRRRFSIATGSIGSARPKPNTFE